MNDLTNYAAAAGLTRACSSLESLKERERKNEKYYNLGLLTENEYGRISVVEMEVFARISNQRKQA